jgi:hypothetical protein
MGRTKARSSLCIAVVSAAFISILSAQGESGKAGSKTRDHRIVPMDQARWTEPPKGMIHGAPSIDPGGTLKYALISGEPMKAGAPFTVRLACTDGYKAAPHWHPTDENIVVLQGAFAVGTGDTLDSARAQHTPTGGYIFMPARMHHFGICKGETDVLIYGTGPFQINFLSAPASGTHKSASK